MTNVLFIAVVLIALASQSPAGQAGTATRTRPGSAGQRPAADPLQEAEFLLQKQQYAQAEEKLQHLMAAQGKNPQAWFDLGFAQSHQAKTKDAVASYQKAVELAPDWFEANLNLGLDMVKSGSSATAIPVLKRAVTLKPVSGGQKAIARAWLGLGEALDSSDPKAAATAYDKASELDSADPELLVRAGAAFERAGDQAGAEQRFTKAADAGSANGMSRLIAVLASQQRYNDAAGWLNKYVAQNPGDAKARVELAQLLTAQGKKEDAISMLEATKSASSNPSIESALASLYLDAKQYDKAANILPSLIQKSPGDAQLRWDLGSALMHQHQYPQAESEMLAALKINSSLESDYWELAYVAQQNQHYELAIRVLDARAQRFQETPTTYWIRAVSYDSLGAVKPAAANYKLFLDADGGKSPEQEFKARHRLKAIEPK